MEKNRLIATHCTNWINSVSKLSPMHFTKKALKRWYITNKHIEAKEYLFIVDLLNIKKESFVEKYKEYFNE